MPALETPPFGPTRIKGNDDEHMAKPAAKHLDIKDMSFEKALKELESIVGRLERGDVELEESINIYERGEALKEHCDRLLKQAEAKVEKLTFNQAGRAHRHRALQAAGVMATPLSMPCASAASAGWRQRASHCRDATSSGLRWPLRYSRS